MSELARGERRDLVAAAWRRCDGVLLVVEPGTPATFEVVREARKQLLRGGGQLRLLGELGKLGVLAVDLYPELRLLVVISRARPCAGRAVDHLRPDHHGHRAGKYDLQRLFVKPSLQLAERIEPKDIRSGQLAE